MKSGIKNKTLTVLTFNVGLLDVDIFGRHLLQPAPYVKERLRALPSILIKKDPDLIALQELYEQEQRDYLISKLKHHYPYHFYSRQKRIFRLENSLMFFSKTPFVGKRVVAFRDEPLEDDFFTFKGVIEGAINFGQFGRITFFNTHTTAGGIRDPQNETIENIRHSQIEQIVKCVQKSRSPGIKIILGDINAGPEVSANNYDLFKENKFLDAYLLKHPKSADKKTWDPKNCLNTKGPHLNCPSQRIDHIFIREEDKNVIRIKKADIVFDSECVSIDKIKKVTLSDHYGVLVMIENIK